MRTKKVFKLVVVCLLVSALLVSTLGFAGCEKTTKTIAVMAKGESHAFWQSVKKGAVAASEKYGYTVTFRGPPDETPASVPNQKEYITTALAGNPSGLAIATIATGFNDLLTQAFDKKIPVVQFDSGIWEADLKSINDAKKNPIVSSVATSNEKAAAVAAQNYYAAVKADIVGDFKMGIIQHDTSNTGIDRVKGFKDEFEKLAKADGKTVTVIVEVKTGDANGAYKAALESLAQKGVKHVFMTNEGVVKQCADAVEATSQYDNFKFCGYDAGTKQIEWMKKTTGAKLIGSVAQDSFQIGYQAVEQTIFAIEGKTVTAKVDLGGTWWNVSNVAEYLKSGIVYEG